MKCANLNEQKSVVKRNININKRVGRNKNRVKKCKQWRNLTKKV